MCVYIPRCNRVGRSSSVCHRRELHFSSSSKPAVEGVDNIAERSARDAAGCVIGKRAPYSVISFSFFRESIQRGEIDRITLRKAHVRSAEIDCENERQEAACCEGGGNVTCAAIFDEEPWQAAVIRVTRAIHYTPLCFGAVGNTFRRRESFPVGALALLRRMRMCKIHRSG